VSLRRLLFISPRFLFPADSGGRIRTTQILRGLIGGAFEITLVSPGSPALAESFGAELDSVSDHWKYWQEPEKGVLFRIKRMRHVFSSEPVPVVTDRSTAGSELVAHEIAKKPDVVVFDFPHSAVLAPIHMDVPSVMFTHNIEAEIFQRHIDVTLNPVYKQLWRNQTRKMARYEATTLARFDAVIAVSDRDKRAFEESYQIKNVRVISTGVDLDFFHYSQPAADGCVLFLGSMDWLANIDAINWFMDEIWPRVIVELPDVRMKVVGRSPPASLVSRAKSLGLNWEFTGFVEDVRDHVKDVSAFVIPLRVGGGTRIKVNEAIAMGMPVVSTSIGVEGLPLEAGRHFLRADNPVTFANATLKLLGCDETRNRISVDAYRFVSENCSSRRVAKEFEEICLHVAEPGAQGADHA